MTPKSYARIKELFFQAHKLDEDEREAFLQQECADDSEVREEVLSLLEHHAPQTILVDPVRAGETVVSGGLPTHLPHRYFRALKVTVGKLAESIALNRMRRITAILLAVGLLFGVGTWMYRGIKVSLNEILASKLQTILDADVTALEIWMAERKSIAEIWARHPDVREAVTELMAIGRANQFPREELLASSGLARLRKELHSFGTEPGEAGFAVIGRDGLVLAAEQDEHVGLRLKPDGVATIAPVFAGKTTITKPFPE